MSVHVPGPRLYRTIPFKHLAQKGQGSARASNVAINVTPFVDMMTILVTFLLMVFAGDELAKIEKGLELPEAIFGSEMRRSPVISITQEQIKLDQKIVVDSLASITNTRGSKGKERWAAIPSLQSRLEKIQYATVKSFDRWEQSPPSDQEKQEVENCKKKPKNPTEFCLRDLILIQADRRVPAVVINRVMASAKRYSKRGGDGKPMYRQFMFLVKQKGRE